jgi:uncharacterized delta-60 repeat protein
VKKFKDSLVSLILLSFFLVSFSTLSQEWVNIYNGADDGEDHGYAIAVDTNSNVYVTGWSENSGYYDYATIKYTSSGDTSWIKRYDGPSSRNDFAYAIATDESGNVYVTGTSYDLTTSYDYATIKYKPSGDTAWVRRYNSPSDNSDKAYGIAVDKNGNVYITGESSYDYATIKYTPTGVLEWIRRYDGPANDISKAYAIAVDTNSNVYVTGYSKGEFSGYDYATVKYTSSGDTAWIQRYNVDNDQDEAHAIAVDDSGNCYVTGETKNTNNDFDYTTIKYKPSGDTAWIRKYDGPENNDDRAYSVAVDESGNVYVTGWSQNSSAHYKYATIKYTSSGDIAWIRRYEGSVGSEDQASAVAVDGSGNVFVTGRSEGSGNEFDYATIKYTSSGDTAWIERYNGTANDIDKAYALALDKDGNAYITGESYNTGTEYDFATIMYSVSSGVEEKELFADAQNVKLEAYPNPMNKDVTISYQVTLDSKISLEIYDLSGTLVNTLVREHKKAGYHTVIWNGKNKFDEEVPTGIYFLSIETGNSTATKKLTILK